MYGLPVLTCLLESTLLGSPRSGHEQTSPSTLTITHTTSAHRSVSASAHTRNWAARSAASSPNTALTSSAALPIVRKTRCAMAPAKSVPSASPPPDTPHGKYCFGVHRLAAGALSLRMIAVCPQGSPPPPVKLPTEPAAATMEWPISRCGCDSAADARVSAVLHSNAPAFWGLSSSVWARLRRAECEASSSRSACGRPASAPSSPAASRTCVHTPHSDHGPQLDSQYIPSAYPPATKLEYGVPIRT